MKPIENNPKFTNALVDSKSLYLRQHAHNPVMWHPWSGEAIQLAKKLNRPILLSIGYSSCYWCHVMEREVFENPSIAAFMNEHFVNIKVDREEHPDIDEIYMVARQLMTREGGWPNNLILTPELKPFFAGGTFGAKDAGERPAFPRVLEWVHYMWQERREEVLKTSDEIFTLTQQYLRASANQPGEAPSVEQLVVMLLGELQAKHDDVRGGFYNQPKFPHETYLDFLCFAGQVFNYKTAIDIAARTALAMSAGGIYDQVGCGFHRYAIDKSWLVPHFEKMLYNQAMLASVYTDLYDLTQNPNLASVAEATLDFVSGPMHEAGVGFFSAIDAETDGVEGAYYAWDAKEIEKILTQEEFTFFGHYFGLADIPHFTGHKKVHGEVIVARKSLWDAAKEDNLPYIQLSALAGQVMNKLLSVRNQRQAPLLDDKIITGWNGLMIAAYAKASVIFGRSNYLTIAEEAMRNIFRHAFQPDGSLSRILGVTSPFRAPLEDYAYLAYGLMELHHASPKAGWLGKARQVMQAADELFFDAARGLYRSNYLYEHLPEIAHISDGVLPSPAALMLDNWVALYRFEPDEELYQRLSAMVEAMTRLVKPQTIAEYATFIKAAVSYQLLKDEDDAFIKRTQALLSDEGEVLKPVVSLSAAFLDADPKARRRKIRVDFEVSEGWYIQPHISKQIATAVEITGENIQRIISIEYPKSQKLEVGGHTIASYTGKQQIVVECDMQADMPRKPIVVNLHFQACREGLCSPKAKVSFHL